MYYTHMADEGTEHLGFLPEIWLPAWRATRSWPGLQGKEKKVELTSGPSGAALVGLRPLALLGRAGAVVDDLELFLGAVQLQVWVAVTGQRRVQEHGAATHDDAGRNHVTARLLLVSSGRVGGRQQRRHNCGSREQLGVVVWVVLCVEVMVVVVVVQLLLLWQHTPPVRGLVVRLLRLRLVLPEACRVLAEYGRGRRPPAAGRMAAAAIFQLDALLHVCEERRKKQQRQCHVASGVYLHA